MTDERHTADDQDLPPTHQTIRIVPDRRYVTIAGQYFDLLGPSPNDIDITASNYSGICEVEGCTHPAFHMCSPNPGEVFLVQQVLKRKGIQITGRDLEETFGPQWAAVVSVVRRAAVLTRPELEALDEAWNLSTDANRAAIGAIWQANRDDAWRAAGDAASDALNDTAQPPARYSVLHAAEVVVSWDLATVDGEFTFAHRDLLIAPWVKVCGLPENLLESDGAS